MHSPRKRYAAQARKKDLERQRKIPTDRIAAFEMVQDDIIRKFPLRDVTLDFAAYQRELDRTLSVVAALQEEISGYRQKLTDLSAKKNEILQEIRIIHAAEAEARGNFDVVAHSLDSNIVCPTCNAEYPNDIRAGFRLAVGHERSVDLLLQLHVELEHVQADIQNQASESSSVEARLAERMNDVMSDVRGAELRDFISIGARFEMGEAIQTAVNAESVKFDAIRNAEKLAETEMKSFENKRFKAEVEQTFRERYAFTPQPRPVGVALRA